MKSKPANILIVEDNRTNQLILSRRLKNSGHTIAKANNGREALEIINKENFDLILLDILMPEMDGFEVCKVLKETPETQDIPIIFITSMKNVDSTIKGFELGAVDYITKPFNSVELLARINTHLELKRSREKLKQLNAEKDKFLSIVAHDIKNPLSAILLTADFLSDKPDLKNASQLTRGLSTIKNSAYKLHKLLENLLEWSRSQIGRKKYVPEQANLKWIIEENINLLTENAMKKDINLFSTVDHDITVTVDVNMIMTVIRNLISNALKFTNEGGEVCISVDDKKEFWEVSVSDTGIGISQENLKKLFRIDVSYSTSGTNQESGTGLGLILCKEFVEKNGGQIWVESDLGTGSTFRFTIPKHPESN